MNSCKIGQGKAFLKKSIGVLGQPSTRDVFATVDVCVH
jgi:hypothetical protein